MRPSGSTSVFVLTLLWIFYSFTPVLASLSNITADDTGSGIQYSPLTLWNDGSNCDACTARPDVTKASGGTWHDSTHQSGSNDVSFASLRFTGSAVYVFCIIAHSSVSPDGNSDMVIFIDGQQVGMFVLAPTGQNVYEYNVPVYVNTSIPSGTHTITIQNGRAGGAKSLILLDSIVFTTGEVDPTVTPSSQLPAPITQTVTAIPVPPSSAIPSTFVPSQISISISLPSVTSQSTSGTSSSTSPFTDLVTAAITSHGQDDGSFRTSSEGPAPSSSGAARAAANASNDTEQKSRTTIIAAVVPSVIALLLIIGALIFFCLRRRRQKHDYYAPPEPQIANDPEASGWAQDTWSPRGQGSDMQTVMSPSSFNAVSVALFSASGSSESGGTVKSTPAAASTSQVGRTAARMTMSSVSSASVYSASDQDHAPLPMPPYGDVSPTPLSAVTEESMLVSSTSSRHPYAIRTPIATTPEPDFYADASVPTANIVPAVAEPRILSKAEEAGMFPMPPPLPPLPPAGARPLPTLPMTESSPSRNTQVRRTNTSVTSDVPPAYENISRDDAVRL